MYSREKHIGKSREQRQSYGRYIRSLDYEPTIEEGIDFGSTEKGGEELSESTSQRKSRGYTKNRIREHIKDHWIEWIIGGLIVFGLFLINESRITTAIMGNTLTDTKTKVEGLNTDIRNLDQKIDNLELQSVINSKDIEFLKNNE